MVEQLQTLTDGRPVYVVTQKDAAMFVDKLTLGEKDAWQRKRYVVNGKQCTCMGWMKTGHCKHLKMVNGDWEGTGVSAEAAGEFYKQIVGMLGKLLKKDVDGMELNTDLVPEEVFAIDFEVDDPKGTMQVILIEKKVGDRTIVAKIMPKG